MKKYLALVTSFVIAISLAACGGNDNSSSTDSSSNQTTESEQNQDVEPAQEKEPEITKYKASTYKVGTDIPAGEYVLFCDGISGYFQISSDSSGSFEAIVANDNFYTNSIVTVSDGQYFQISSSYAVPIEEVNELDTTKDGMFKIGTHLPAGEYKLTVAENSTMGSGYYEVNGDSSHSFNSIISNGNFEGDTYITVSDGQYLKLVDCYIAA
ncbi:MAG: hypothetical protein ACOYJ9_06415 [Candidatus Metalachnospira sp.]|jgi:hypothetical protein